MIKEQIALVITGDLHGREVYKKLCSQKFLLDTKEKFGVNFAISNDQQFLFEIKQKDMLMSVLNVRSIYCKRIIIDICSDGTPAYILDFIQRETQEIVVAVIGVCLLVSNGVVINQGKQFSIARNKILQLIVASDIGLLIPNTCVTNDVSVAQNFYMINQKNIIYKCLSQPVIDYGDNIRSMIHTSKVNSDDFSKVHHCPSLFQENIKKQYELRIAVIKDKVISVRINSQKFKESKQDWRKEIYNKDIYQSYKLPEEIERKLITLNSRLNLSWSMIDMIFTGSKYVFLEANPDGAWLWLEQFFPELDITNSISSVLNVSEGVSYD